LSEKLLETVERIKLLQVQGARNVAVAAATAFAHFASESSAKTRIEFLKQLHEARDLLYNARETEPLMRNAVKYILDQVECSQSTSKSELAAVAVKSAEVFLETLEATKERIAEVGAKRIRDGARVFTHCHSSTVMHLLKKAWQTGKRFEVVCTETRPAFQGRITARALTDSGIKTTLIVDSAARVFIGKVDLIVVGADALTSEGNVVNKIGTSMIALAAHEARKPFYVVTELLKLDPATACGDYEPIEERSPNEVWSDPPEGLAVRNPAFDVTTREYIHGLICEEGIIPPHMVLEAARRVYPWLFRSGHS